VLKNDRIRIGDSTDIKLVFGHINTYKDRKSFTIHIRTSFGLKGEGRSLLNQTSRLTRVVNPINLLWLKAGNRLHSWLESQGEKSCPALPVF
jgi:hypothetical protein